MSHVVGISPVSPLWLEIKIKIWTQKKSWSLKQKFARSHKAGDFPQMPHFTQNCVPILTKFSPHRMWLQGKFLSLNNISSNNEHSNANVLKYQCVLSDKQKLEEATSEP